MDSNDRSIILSKNWKKRQLEELNIIKNEMIKNNVSEDLIQKYIDEEYESIEQKFNEKINKHLLNKEKNKDKPKNLKQQQKNKSIDFLIKNKAFLEKQGVKPDIINEYVNLEYDKITKMFI